MKVFIWLMKKISGLAWFFFRILVRVAEYVLKAKYDEGYRCYVYVSGGRSRAIYLVKTNGTWFTMSNQRLMGSFQTTVIRRFFQDKTLWFYVI